MRGSVFGWGRRRGGARLDGMDGRRKAGGLKTAATTTVFGAGCVWAFWGRQSRLGLARAAWGESGGEPPNSKVGWAGWAPRMLRERDSLGGALRGWLRVGLRRIYWMLVADWLAEIGEEDYVVLDAAFG